MRIFTLIIGLLFTLPSLANWQLANDKSQFNFVTTKKNSATEVHQFTQLKGAISPKGKVNLTIDLSSVETNIPIRNERMQKFLFETNLFPKASFTTSIDNQVIEKLNVGEVARIEIAGEIALHGAKKTVTTQVQVIKLGNNNIMVNSLKPIIIQANDFNLVAGVEKLKALAVLPSISNAVPISFSLYFTQ
ncbi:YceI family protein [Pseudocolwellia agarivorans]|uniref:YceI family protein n=1 Tax=Pseudocolwellia agarivorans TaxID=1911682 RepID=UPI000984378B|nr:YceI family protein [Pseudocolwellia agarivorans]